jgi:Carboxypeptidase regulatory-like domain
VLIRRVIFTLWSAWPALACVCVSYEPIKTCQIYQSAPVIFRGRVIDHNDNGSGHFTQMTLYRFKVLEAFKGLSPEVKELFINPGSGTDGYRTFASDRDYLIYTGSAYPTPPPAADFLIAMERTKPKPPAWNGLEQLPVYDIFGCCNPSRVVDEKDPDVAYLRSASKIGPQSDGWIEGRIGQNLSRLQRAEFSPVPDATISVTFPDGKNRSVNVQPDGTFKTDPLSPGIYAIMLQSSSFGYQKAEKAEVPTGGCAVFYHSFQSSATISGRILDHDGKPVPGIRLELGELQADGNVRIRSTDWANSDQQGNFKITNVPVGRVVLAAKLDGAPDERMPFDAFFAPGTRDVVNAQVFALQADQQLTGVTLRLPEPLPFGDLFVDVKWPDGTAAVDGARAFSRWNGVRADSGLAPKGTNRVKLRLALNRKYEITVDWFSNNSLANHYVTGATPQTVDFARDGQTVELRLKAR